MCGDCGGSDGGDRGGIVVSGLYICIITLGYNSPLVERSLGRSLKLNNCHISPNIVSWMLCAEDKTVSKLKKNNNLTETSLAASFINWFQ